MGPQACCKAQPSSCQGQWRAFIGPCPAFIPQADTCSVLHWLDCAPQYTQARFCQQDAKRTQASSDGRIRNPRGHKSTNPQSQRVDLFQRPPPLETRGSTSSSVLRLGSPPPPHTADLSLPNSELGPVGSPPMGGPLMRSEVSPWPLFRPQTFCPGSGVVQLITCRMRIQVDY